MALEVTWLREGEIILIRFSGRVTIEEVKQANIQATRFNESVAQGVHMIVDVTKVTGFPFNLIQLQRAIVHYDAANLGWIIAVIDKHPLLEYVTSTLVQLFSMQNRWRIVSSVGDAVKLLDQLAFAGVKQPPT